MFLLSLGVNSAWAHTFDWTIDSLELGSIAQIEHTEDTKNPGGWVDISVTNTGSEAWGDFHFEFYEVSGYDITNLHWTGASSSQSGMVFMIDNDVIGATLDLYFYGDPLLPGETGTFSGYSDNTDAIGLFGVAVHPTPVPVPAAAWLLGSGLIGLVGLRRKQ